MSGCRNDGSVAPFDQEGGPRSKESGMAIEFNHTILAARDSRASSTFLAEMLGLPAPKRWGPFEMVTTANGANLDYMGSAGDIAPQHYAFLSSEDEFDEILGRIRDRKLSYWADPERKRQGEINHHDGGRGVYFEDPNGHLLEVITRPYGSGGWDP
jgi:catechol 2,3-dioxygenase-like lactoylglutathione lyase family enzyme